MRYISIKGEEPYEATLLKLNCEKAQNLLNWYPLLDFKETVELTTTWYKSYYEKKMSLFDLNMSQINFYQEKAISRGAFWITD